MRRTLQFIHPCLRRQPVGVQALRQVQGPLAFKNSLNYLNPSPFTSRSSDTPLLNHPTPSTLSNPSTYFSNRRPATTLAAVLPTTVQSYVTQILNHNLFKNFHPDANQPETDKPARKTSKRSEEETDNDATKPSDTEVETEKESPIPKIKISFKKNSDNKGPDEDEDENNKKEDENPNWNLVALGLAFLLYVVYKSEAEGSLSVDSFGGNLSNEISLQEFVGRYLEKGLVERLEVHDRERVKVFLKNDHTPYFFTIGSVDSFERVVSDSQYDAGVDPANFVPIKYVIKDTSSIELVEHLIQLTLLVGMGYIMYAGVKKLGGGGQGSKMFRMHKAGFTKIMPGDKTSVKFADVAGCDEAKVEVMEFVSFLKDPERFTRLGAKIPKGALLAGSPGTGKTLLAKATAGEAGVPFFSISGSEFLEMFVGVGPSRVRDLFAEARKNKPSIIFIDEIDAVGRSRESGKYGGGGNDERENTLNQLLVEMDGFSSDTGVVVLAGTNRPDILDKALLRPGRFDRQITIEAPDIKGRKQIFLVHLEGLLTFNDKDEIATKIAALTPGFSGADIANICNEAALIAARANKEYIEEKDFEQAVERVIGGLESNRHVLSVYEKKLVAFHEAGHAVAGWFREHADPVLKVTIIPRSSGALGFAQYLPRESALQQMDQLSDKMDMIMGGRAAEQIFFGQISTGASNDIERATQIAFDIITKYGMGETVPNLGFKQDNPYHREFSETTAALIDEEAKGIVAASYARTLELLEDKRDLVKALANKLIEVETVNHEVIVGILGPRPFASDVYQDFLNNEHKALKESAEATKEKEDKAKAAEAVKEDAQAEEGEGEDSVTTEDAEKASEEVVKEVSTEPEAEDSADSEKSQKKKSGDEQSS